MPQADGLVLRDIHAATAPSWWPPAPGWAVSVALLLVVAGAGLAWRGHRRRRRRSIEALFDDLVDAASTPANQVAAMSDLLRRAARRHVPDAGTLCGEAWATLVASATPSADAWPLQLQALLLEGGYRRAVDVDVDDVRRLRMLARPLFIHWMCAR